MIKELFETDNPRIREDLERIDQLVSCDTFLKGLGFRADDVPLPKGFPVVRDAAKAKELLIPADLYELPAPWPYQELFGVIEDEAGLWWTASAAKEEESYRYVELRTRISSDVEKVVDRHIESRLNSEGVVEKLRKAGNGASLDEKDFRFFAEDALPHNVSAHIDYMIEAAYSVGLKNSPLLNRMFEAFQTGGFPCGWLGPLPEDGGDPVKAIALLHFGRPLQT